MRPIGGLTRGMRWRDGELIDLGPEGGSGGGEVLYQGVPEGIVGVEGSHRAGYLGEKEGEGGDSLD